MITQTIQASKPYPVKVGRGLLKDAGNLLKEQLPSPSNARLVIISDSNVRPLYETQLLCSLGRAGYTVLSYEIPAGEASKNWRMLGSILEFLAEQQVTRHDCLIALGGGVTGDITGFAASIYMRGIAFVQIPTTLLAAVDSSVGGKTAVNLTSGKNLAGSFWQPAAVLCDTDTFSTLSADIFLDGVAESIKYGILKAPSLFQAICHGGLKNDTEQIVSQCIAIKGAVVAEDEFDLGTRALLNFGHTFGHAIETCSRYQISHGHAVAIGMHMAANVSDKLGLCDSYCSHSITDALESLGFSLSCPYSTEDIYMAMKQDKKRNGTHIDLILPYAIGDCRIYPAAIEQLPTLIAPFCT